MNYSDLQLAELHADALFVHDARGRMLVVNEPDSDQPAPRFFLSRTSQGNMWRARYDLPDDLAGDLERLASEEPVAGNADEMQELPRNAAQYTGLLERHAPVKERSAGPAFWLPELDPHANAVTIDHENSGLLRAHFPFTLSRLHELSPIVVVVEEGVAVAICFCARRTAHVAEAGVYTEEAYRGRGYAEQTVRGWATDLRATGRLPLYSTWWENAASRAVAARLGAVLYAADFGLT